MIKLSWQPILQGLEIFLHFGSIFKAEGMKDKLDELGKLMKSGKIEEAKQFLKDFTTFIDEIFHSRSVRGIPPDKRKNYDAFMAQLAEKDEFGVPKNFKYQELHDYVIICIATEDDEDECKAMVMELAQCKTLEEFIKLIYARGYDRPSLPIQHKMKKIMTGFWNFIKGAAGTIKSLARDFSAEVARSQQRMDENLSKSGFVAWTERIREKAEALNEKEG